MFSTTWHRTSKKKTCSSSTSSSDQQSTWEFRRHRCWMRTVTVRALCRTIIINRQTNSFAFYFNLDKYIGFSTVLWWDIFYTCHMQYMLQSLALNPEDVCSRYYSVFTLSLAQQTTIFSRHSCCCLSLYNPPIRCIYIICAYILISVFLILSKTYR